MDGWIGRSILSTGYIFSVCFLCIACAFTRRYRVSAQGAKWPVAYEIYAALIVIAM